MFSGMTHSEMVNRQTTLGSQPNVMGMFWHRDSGSTLFTDAASYMVANTTVQNKTLNNADDVLDDKRARAVAMGLTLIRPRRDISSRTRELLNSIVLPAYRLPVDVGQLQVRYGTGGNSTYSGPFPPRNANPVILNTVITVLTPSVPLPPMFTKWLTSASKVVNQLECGGCWAVSVASALADRVAITKGVAAPLLSFTSILACVTSDVERLAGAMLEVPNTLGCDGGLPSAAVELLAVDGATTEACAPYTWCLSLPECASPLNVTSPDAQQKKVEAQNDAIPACASMRGVQVRQECEERVHIQPYADGTFYMNLGDVQSIQSEIRDNGPVVATYAVYEDFLAGTAARVGDDWARTRNVYCNVQDGARRPYSGTRYAGSETRLTGYHAVVIVGWGVEDAVPDWRGSGMLSIPYWIVRNSWGTSWNPGCVIDGAQWPGYFKIAMTNPELSLNTRVFLDNTDDDILGAVIAFQPKQPLRQRIQLVSYTSTESPLFMLWVLLVALASVRVILYALRK